MGYGKILGTTIGVGVTLHLIDRFMIKMKGSRRKSNRRIKRMKGKKTSWKNL